MEPTPHPYAPDECWVIPPGWAVPDLPGYAEGVFTVQDPATLAAVRLLDPQPGETVWDACAAPGGKAALIADRMDGRGRLFATDRYDDRLERLRDNLRRLQLAEVTVQKIDLRAPGEAADLPAEFDRILLDVPCSNTGVLRRKPDARWRFSGDRLADLVELQGVLLDRCASRLKKGGVLVYSTCSLEADENQSHLQRWLARRPEFRLEREVVLFPPRSRTDGAYAARLVR
ncbi:MAG: Ribosomal RNA small subunit methyltransferase B [candidate division BRC1 bacterium ADurb.BinA292]|nr:MAG: Ribosomal RNA small subunit methyltransferase B [candidate division BRC1 bacterium ADurb.BinA292]